MSPEIITNEDGEDIGLRFRLDDIIRRLENKYSLTREDYLFLFDFTCSIFTQDINPTGNKRLQRSFGRQIAKEFGFGIKRTKKRTNKRSKKRTKKRSKNKNVKK